MADNVGRFFMGTYSGSKHAGFQEYALADVKTLAKVSDFSFRNRC